MTSAEKHLFWFLRLTAVLLISAAGAVVMPYTWMNATHEWLGLGMLPAMPLVGYLTRSLSALYACLGLCYWFVAADLRRYLPLVRFSLPITWIFAITLIGVDVAVALPMWWTAIEGPFLLAWTLTLWWLLRRLPSDEIT